MPVKAKKGETMNWNLFILMVLVEFPALAVWIWLDKFPPQQ